MTQTTELPFVTNGGTRRTVAAVIDFLIILLSAFVSGLFLGLISIVLNSPAFDSIFLTRTSSYVIVILLSFLLYTLIPYFIFDSQTIGKKICKIKIVNRQGNKPSFLQFVGRTIFFDLCITIPCVAIISALVLSTSKNHQAIHDMAVDTYVVNAK